MDGTNLTSWVLFLPDLLLALAFIWNLSYVNLNVMLFIKNGMYITKELITR